MSAHDLRVKHSRRDLKDKGAERRQRTSGRGSSKCKGPVSKYQHAGEQTEGQGPEGVLRGLVFIL